METSQNTGTHVLVGSILLLGLPLVIFPDLFGSQPLKVSWQYFIYEFAFYGLLALVLFRARSIGSVIKIAATAFGYRMLMSVLFSFIIVAVYSWSIASALQAALISYIPGVLLQVLLSPAACWPILNSFEPRRRRVMEPMRPASPAQSPQSPKMPFPATSVHERADGGERATARSESHRTEAPMMVTRLRAEANPVQAAGEANGFERAVRYVGEHGSVMYAAVVDTEGLLLANHHRGKVVPEDLAPLAIMFLEHNREVLEKGSFEPAEKIDITLRNRRLIVGRVESWCLMVLSERQADDLLNVRIAQGMDMLKKFAAERYSVGQHDQVENAHV